MRKIIPIAIILIAIISNIQCATRNKKAIIENLIKTEGWIDNNTYRIVAEGKPVDSIQSMDKRKDSAKRAAKMNAWFKILKKFKSMNRAKKNTKIDTSHAQVVQNIIKNGFIIDEIYDEFGNCEIIYEVYEKNLKTMVSGTDLSGIEIIN